MFHRKIVEKEVIKEVLKEVPLYIFDCGCRFRVNLSVYFSNGNLWHGINIEHGSRIDIKCAPHRREVIISAVNQFNKLEEKVRKDYYSDFIVKLHRRTDISLCKIETLMREQTPNKPQNPTT